MARGLLPLSFAVMLAASLSLAPSSCDHVAPAAGCRANADCRLFSDYCTGCECRSLPTGAADPTCNGPGVQCFVDPCQGKSAVCTNGACVVSGP